MVSLKTSILLGPVALLGVTVAAHAQPLYQPYAYPYQVDPYYRVPPATPPSWSYDPYTSGMTACP
jgi:hypothetical protein